MIAFTLPHTRQPGLIPTSCFTASGYDCCPPVLLAQGRHLAKQASRAPDGILLQVKAASMQRPFFWLFAPNHAAYPDDAAQITRALLTKRKLELSLCALPSTKYQACNVIERHTHTFHG